MLRLCAHCDRHVHFEGKCPYCGGHEAAQVPAAASWKGGRRSAFITFTAAALTSTACGDAVAVNLFYGDPSAPTYYPFDASTEAGPRLLPNPDSSADGAAEASADGAAKDATTDAPATADADADANADGGM